MERKGNGHIDLSQPTLRRCRRRRRRRRRRLLPTRPSPRSATRPEHPHRPRAKQSQSQLPRPSRHRQSTAPGLAGLHVASQHAMCNIHQNRGEIRSQRRRSACWRAFNWGTSRPSIGWPAVSSTDRCCKVPVSTRLCTQLPPLPSPSRPAAGLSLLFHRLLP